MQPNADTAPRTDAAFERQQQMLLADLYELVQVHPELRASLAVAWRLGYNRAVLDGPGVSPWLIDNPFWAIPPIKGFDDL